MKTSFIISEHKVANKAKIERGCKYCGVAECSLFKAVHTKL